MFVSSEGYDEERFGIVYRKIQERVPETINI